jgi:hypothetical protein
MVAVTVQVPDDVDVSVLPEMLHPVAVPLVEEYVTEPAVVPPEVARVSAVPYVPEVEVSASAACAAWLIVNERSEVVLATALLPACVARTVHVPAVTIVTDDPDTVHTDAVCEAKVTAPPEEAVAEIVNGASP